MIDLLQAEFFYLSVAWHNLILILDHDLLPSFILVIPFSIIQIVMTSWTSSIYLRGITWSFGLAKVETCNKLTARTYPLNLGSLLYFSLLCHQAKLMWQSDIVFLWGTDVELIFLVDAHASSYGISMDVDSWVWTRDLTKFVFISLNRYSLLNDNGRCRWLSYFLSRFLNSLISGRLGYFAHGVLFSILCFIVIGFLGR